jgi:hypothetical protein
LQERLEAAGVRTCIVAACNAGRLFRPEIYYVLDAAPGDPLFEPATLGIINSSAPPDRQQSGVLMARREDSEVEITNEGRTSEFSTVTQTLLGLNRAPTTQARPGAAGQGARVLRFVVSNMLIQLVTNDPAPRLTTGYVRNKSSYEYSDQESELLFQRFLQFVNGVAEREYENSRPE